MRREDVKPAREYGWRRDPLGRWHRCYAVDAPFRAESAWSRYGTWYVPVRFADGDILHVEPRHLQPWADCSAREAAWDDALARIRAQGIDARMCAAWLQVRVKDPAQAARIAAALERPEGER